MASRRYWSGTTRSRRHYDRRSLLIAAAAGVGLIRQGPALAGRQDARPAPVDPSAASETTLGRDGNRFIAGHGRFPPARAVDLPLTAAARWVVAVSQPDGASLWVAVPETGPPEAFHVSGGDAVPVDLAPPTAEPSAGAPPLLRVTDGCGQLVVAPPALDPSPLTAPLLVDGSLVIIDRQGQVVIADAARPTTVRATFPLATPPDARLVTDGAGRVAVLSGVTNERYVHGVLGDDLEASGLAIIDITADEPAVIHQIMLSPPTVIEGMAPIWTELEEPRGPGLLVTISDGQEGARLALFSLAGERAATGAGFGQGGRWRHQLAIAPFGPNGESEIAAVRTPHIGGVVEFVRRDGDRLRTVAELPGYSSHRIGSRNLDQAVAGDFDGDGQPEVIVPSQDQRRLGAIRHEAAGATVAWELELGGALVTNLAAVATPDGLTLGAGRADGLLRVWVPGSG